MLISNVVIADLLVDPDRALPLLIWALALATPIVVWRYRSPLVRTALRGLTRVIYRLRVIDHDHIPESGGAVLAPNHIAFIDVIVLGDPDQTPNLARRLSEGTMHVLETLGDDRQALAPILDGLKSDERLGRETTRQAVLDRMEALTSREREVLSLITDGKSNKVIAAELSISPKTVEVHRSQVMRKMEAESLGSLVRMVVLAESERWFLPLSSVRHTGCSVPPLEIQTRGTRHRLF